jgi:hypothetical protein
MTDFNKPRPTPEDEAFNDIERQAQQRKEAVKATVENNHKMYLSGWNAALELAAFEIENNFTKAFGKDTLSSLAIYIREMKK